MLYVLIPSPFKITISIVVLNSEQIKMNSEICNNDANTREHRNPNFTENLIIQNTVSIVVDRFLINETLLHLIVCNSDKLSNMSFWTSIILCISAYIICHRLLWLVYQIHLQCLWIIRIQLIIMLKVSYVALIFKRAWSTGNLTLYIVRIVTHLFPHYR